MQHQANFQTSVSPSTHIPHENGKIGGTENDCYGAGVQYIMFTMEGEMSHTVDNKLILPPLMTNNKSGTASL